MSMTQEPKSIEELTAQGRELLNEHKPTTADGNFYYWDAIVAKWLDENYPGTGLSAEWSSLGNSPLVIGQNYFDDPNAWLLFRKIVQSRLQWISRIPRVINYKTESAKSYNRHPKVALDKVFVVHGRDEAIKEKVARFLESIHLRPIILHEQPNQGRTIIEKFVDYADVAFAIVLLTPDDKGGLATDLSGDYKFRARQNVILELGYFLGQLGRQRVCALYAGDVEIPSDYNGVLFIPVDEAEGWKMKLAKEMKAATLPIYMNGAI